MAFPFLGLFIIMKAGLKYIDKIVKLEIKKIIKEEDISLTNPTKSAEEQLKYDEEQLEKTKEEIKKLKNWEVQASSDMKGFQQKQRLSKDPIEKSIATTSLNKIAIPKSKDLKNMVSQKEEELSSLENKIKSDNLKLNYAKKGISVSSSNSDIQENKLTMKKEYLKEQEELSMNQSNVPQNKAYLVKFDKNTQAPFDVKFTERGFSIDGTRLSFEALENALSKNYTITLNNGKGLALDAIRMQKILKYKNKWFKGQ